jgi:CrcB protein
MPNLFWIAVGGAMGAIARFKVFDVAQRYVSGFFPWGTLAVNVIGSFVAGLLWTFFDRFNLPMHLKTFIFMGFLGSFTTFSHYTLETIQLVRVGQLGLALSNFLLSNVLSLAFVLLGFSASRFLIVR